MKQPGAQAHWWRAMDRRAFGKGSLAFATLLSMSGCGSGEEVTSDTLTLQQKHGWNVGAEETRLFFVSGGPSGQDATGSTAWKAYTDPTRLMTAWKPRTAAWEPFFVPTLLQSLRETSLRNQMRPVMTQAMQDAFGRGETIRKDFLSQVANAEATLFIADLPGPESVAFGAGMAGAVDLVVGFDNWPHPLGVVRSHEVLGALLSYADTVNKRAVQPSDAAPGLFLLDRQRLAPYSDNSNRFDNRYIASAIPSVAQLQQRGIQQVMYITPDRKQHQESDDLNEIFVDYKAANIAVNMLPLMDLQRVSEPVSQKAPDGTTRTVYRNHYYYGGGIGSHMGFFLMYSLLAPRPVIYYPSYAGAGYAGRSTSLGNLRRPAVSPPRYTPRARPTMFSGTRVGGRSGVGRGKPSGFGRTTVRTSGGRVTRLGRSSSRSIFGRSGSFGRGGRASS